MTTDPMHDSAEDIARRRYFVMNAIRFTGVMIFFAGLAMTQGVLPGGPTMGAIVAFIGVFDFFFAPQILVKQFKKQDARRDRNHP